MGPRTQVVTSAEAARRLFQEVYYDSIDRQDMQTAVSALHEAVEFDHRQVWQRTDLELGASRWHGRDEVLRFLTRARPRLAAARIRHRVDDLVFQDDRGAFRAHVEGEDGERAPFLVWFGLEDDLVRHYIVRPL
jgi:hypothetical protein